MTKKPPLDVIEEALSIAIGSETHEISRVYENALAIVRGMKAAKMRSPEELAREPYDPTGSEPNQGGVYFIIDLIKAIQDEAFAAGVAAGVQWRDMRDAPTTSKYVIGKYYDGEWTTGFATKHYAAFQGATHYFEFPDPPMPEPAQEKEGE